MWWSRLGPASACFRGRAEGIRAAADARRAEKTQSTIFRIGFTHLCGSAPLREAFSKPQGEWVMCPVMIRAPRL